MKDLSISKLPFEPALISEMESIAVLKEVPAGKLILDIGDYIKGMPIVLEGAIRIMREDEEGDELLLYYLEKGDTCSITMTCCMGDAKSEIRAVAETDVTLLMIPMGNIDTWTTKYRTWRNFVFNSYHRRINELLETIDGIAFERMDQRLKEYLTEKSRVTGKRTLELTHQGIAQEMHTSRVVISRLLKKMEQEGYIEIRRNAIELLGLD